MHVSILILIEGMNGVLLFQNLNTAFGSLADVATYTSTLQNFYLYQPGQNLTVTVYNSTFTFDPADDLKDLTRKHLALFLLDLSARIFTSYQIAVPGDYPSLALGVKNGSIPVATSTDIQLLATQSELAVLEHFNYSSIYLLVAAASFLFFSTLLILIQRYPRHRFAWLSVYTRLLIVIVFVLIGSLTTLGDQLTWAYYIVDNWELPTIAISFFLIVAIDILAMHFTRRSLSPKNTENGRNISLSGTRNTKNQL